MLAFNLAAAKHSVVLQIYFKFSKSATSSNEKLLRVHSVHFLNWEKGEQYWIVKH